MKKIKVSFDTWIQLPGMTGVLGGLIFVGLEMRQSQMIALAAQSQARTSMLLERVGVYTEANLDFQSLLFASSYDIDMSRIKAAQRNTIHQSWFLFENDFERIVIPAYPEIGAIKQKLLELGARFASLSGSGSTVYGIFDEDASAKEAELFFRPSHQTILANPV